MDAVDDYAGVVEVSVANFTVGSWVYGWVGDCLGGAAAPVEGENAALDWVGARSGGGGGRGDGWKAEDGGGEEGRCYKKGEEEEGGEHFGCCWAWLVVEGERAVS